MPVRSLTPFAVAVLAFGVACGAACSHADDHATDAGAQPAETAVSYCVGDPRAQTYAPGLEKAADGGAFKAKLLSIDPNPTARGDNTWQLQLLDKSGAPVDGATIKVKPFMPDHGHPSSITPTVTATGGGKYSVLLNLFMPGLWQITFTVTAGATTDSIVYSFCVQT